MKTQQDFTKLIKKAISLGASEGELMVIKSLWETLDEETQKELYNNVQAQIDILEKTIG